jgi:hypothetical protein
MKIRFAAPVANAATAAIIMLGACSDDGPTTLAQGDVRFAGSSGLGGQTMDITAVEQDGQVTGEARFSFGLVLDLQCADTDTDSLVILGGEVTAEAGDSAAAGDRVAVIIREGDPDSALVWYELPLPEGEVAAGSCREFLGSIPDDPSTDDPFADIAEGDDIETG